MQNRETRPQRHKKILSIVFMPTLACNCSCEYCFEVNEPVTIDPTFWPEIFNSFKRYAVKEEITYLRFYWQGGDLMIMAPDEVRTGVRTAERIFSDSGVTVEHRFQSNLIGYTSAWAPIIKEHFCGHIGSSLDFPNLYRKTVTLEQDAYVTKWIEQKERAVRDGISVSVIALPNNETFTRGAETFYSFFREKAGLDLVQINFPFAPPHGTFNGLPDMERFACFMEDLYHVWIESKRSIRINPFSRLERAVYQDTNCLTCIWAYCCAFNLLAIDPRGTVSQCDCWASSFKEHAFGNICEQPIETILQSPDRKPFLDRPFRLVTETECGECPYWHLCHGGCPTRATTLTDNFFSKDPYCEVYKKIFSLFVKHREPKTLLPNEEVLHV